MRILHVIDSLDVGGAETLLAGLCMHWRHSTLDAEIYVLRGRGPLEDDLRRAGVPVHIAQGNSVYSPGHIWRLARFVKHQRFDLIHVHLYPAQLWVCLAARLSGCRTPIVTTEHSTWNRRRTGLFRWLDRWMYREFSAIAGISEATRNALVDHIGDKAPTIRVVHNGVDSARFTRSPGHPREPKTTALVILSIGSLTQVKDQATIIRALAQIDDAKLVLAGNGPLREELEGLASQLGIRSRVEFLGMRRDIPQLIADADLYVQASKWEGFCLAAVEAMCGGLPCIVSRNTGLEETVGTAGLYFEPGNVDELASALRILSEDPGRRAALSMRSLEQAAKFTLHACSVAYELFYRQAIQQFSLCSDKR